MSESSDWEKCTKCGQFKLGPLLRLTSWKDGIAIRHRLCDDCVWFGLVLTEKTTEKRLNES
jgi:hypothetical protein